MERRLAEESAISTVTMTVHQDHDGRQDRESGQEQGLPNLMVSSRKN